MDNLIIEEVVHMQLCKFCDSCAQVNWFITANFLMLNICNGKVTIVESVPHKTRHALSVDGIFNCIQELQVRLFEDVLQEVPIDEVVHALNTVIPKHVPVFFTSFLRAVFISL